MIALIMAWLRAWFTRKLVNQGWIAQNEADAIGWGDDG
jgi:hypothetical protein